VNSLLLGLLIGTAAFAGVITDPFTTVGGPGGSSGGSTPVNTFGDSGSGYTFTGTACFDGFCPGQATPGHGPDFTVNDPITMHGTAFTMTCMSAAGCGKIGAAFDFNFTTVDPASGTMVPISFSLDGTAPANYSFTVDVTAETCSPCTTLDSGVQTVMADGLGNFNLTFGLGNLTLKNSFAGDITFSFPNGLADGQSINLPGSATLSFASAPVSAAPEPGGISPLLLGVGVLALLAYKRHSN